MGAKKKNKGAGAAKKKMSPEEEAAQRAGEINDIDDDTYKVRAAEAVHAEEGGKGAGGGDCEGGVNVRAVSGGATESELLLDSGEEGTGGFTSRYAEQRPGVTGPDGEARDITEGVPAATKAFAIPKHRSADGAEEGGGADTEEPGGLTPHQRERAEV